MKGIALIELLASLLVFALLIAFSQKLIFDSIHIEQKSPNIEAKIRTVEFLNNLFFDSASSLIQANESVIEGLGKLPSKNSLKGKYFYKLLTNNVPGILCVQFHYSGVPPLNLNWLICKEE